MSPYTRHLFQLAQEKRAGRHVISMIGGVTILTEKYPESFEACLRCITIVVLGIWDRNIGNYEEVQI